MPEVDLSMIQNLLISALCLLVLLGLLGWRILRRLARIERLFADVMFSAHSAAPDPSATETATGSAFEAFLNEDPTRHLLSKSEQFTAYRKWRQEKGLNWSGS